MKKLLFAPALLVLLLATPAHAGYFAFHADVTGHLSDVLGDYGRPDSDDDPDCTADGSDTTEDGCEDDSDDPTVAAHPSTWFDWLLTAFQP